MITGNITITDSFIQSLRMAISYEFKTRHHTHYGLYTKAENVRDAIAILRRIQPKAKQSKIYDKIDKIFLESDNK